MTQKQIPVRFTGDEELGLYEFLRRESFETGLPMAEIMRKGLEIYKKQKGDDNVKVIRMDKVGHERLDVVTRFYVARLEEGKVAPYAVHSEPFLHGNHLRVDLYSDSGPYTKPVEELLADDLRDVTERLIELGVITEVQTSTGQIGYKQGDNYSLPDKVVYWADWDTGAYVDLAGTKWDGYLTDEELLEVAKRVAEEEGVDLSYGEIVIEEEN